MKFIIAIATALATAVAADRVIIDRKTYGCGARGIATRCPCFIIAHWTSDGKQRGTDCGGPYNCCAGLPENTNKIDLQDGYYFSSSDHDFRIRNDGAGYDRSCKYEVIKEGEYGVYGCDMNQ